MTELRRTEMHQVATSAVHTKIRYPRFILYPGRTFLLAVVHEETVCRDPLQLKEFANLFKYESNRSSFVDDQILDAML